MAIILLWQVQFAVWPQLKTFSIRASSPQNVSYLFSKLQVLNLTIKESSESVEYGTKGHRTKFHAGQVGRRKDAMALHANVSYTQWPYMARAAI